MTKSQWAAAYDVGRPVLERWCARAGAPWPALVKLLTPDEVSRIVRLLGPPVVVVADSEM